MAPTVLRKHHPERLMMLVPRAHCEWKRADEQLIRTFKQNVMSGVRF
jgi:hypothetical protein